MGILSFFSKPAGDSKVERLPSGSFTLDRTGRVVASTLPGAFPEALVREIGGVVLEAFSSARAANLALSELHIHYGGLKLIAKDQRGGAMILLAPSR